MLRRGNFRCLRAIDDRGVLVQGLGGGPEPRRFYDIAKEIAPNSRITRTMVWFKSGLRDLGSRTRRHRRAERKFTVAVL
jgi:hypothetical protein